MTMQARFPGTCVTCRGRIAVNDLIVWSKASRQAGHATIEQCLAAQAAMQKQAAAQIAASGVTANAQPIAAFINAAKERGLKYPKVRFLAPDGRSEMRLSVGTERSRTPGAIFVVIAEDFIGRILPDGSVGGQLVQRADILATLDVIAKDPAAAAKAYGALMCRCSFCNLQLTDEGSVEVGYGPICAKHYGLPHAPKGAKKLAEVAA